MTAIVVNEQDCGEIAVKRLAYNAILAASLCGSNAFAQMSEIQNIKVQMIDGRNGKPMASQRVLIFIGNSADAVREHNQSAILTTDQNGFSIPTLTARRAQWLQVFVDGRTPCFAAPNKVEFSVNDIITKGLATPNACSTIVKAPLPGTLIVLPDQLTFWKRCDGKCEKPALTRLTRNLKSTALILASAAFPAHLHTGNAGTLSHSSNHASGGTRR